MKISPQNIKNDERFKNFIKERKLRESTEIIYSRRLSDFCEFIGKTPAKLIEEALKEHNLKYCTQPLII